MRRIVHFIFSRRTMARAAAFLLCVAGLAAPAYSGMPPDPKPASSHATVNVGVRSSSAAMASSAASSAASAASTSTAIKLAVAAPESDKLGDFLRTLGATFIGALLAFLSAQRQRHLQQRRDNIKAGNLALWSLRSMSREAAPLRFAMRAGLAGMRLENPEVPLWLMFQPLTFKPEPVELDVGDMSYLIDTQSGRAAFEALSMAKREHSNLLHAYETHREMGLKAQEALAENGAAEALSVDEIARSIGPRLVAACDAWSRRLAKQVEYSMVVCSEAFRALEAELEGRFRKAAWKMDFEIPSASKFATHKLPPLQPDLEQMLRDTYLDWDELSSRSSMATARQ